jgi:cardiolipin synthase
VPRGALSLPNLITGSRIACSPLLGCLIVNEQYTAALCGCALAAASDVADGYIARRWGMETVLGSYLDPLADKVFIGSTCVSLAAVGALDGRLAALIVARDALLVAGTGVTLWQHARRAGAASPSDVVSALAR